MALGWLRASEWSVFSFVFIVLYMLFECLSCCPLCFIMLRVALGTPWKCDVASQGALLEMQHPIQISEHYKYLTINTIKN